LLTRTFSYTDVYKSYKDKNVVILGASGFIGRWLARALSKIGANIFLFVRDKHAAKRIFDQFGVSGVVFELNLVDDAESLINIFKKISPDVVFNLAGYGVNPSQRDQNLAYTINADLVSIVCKAMATAKGDNWVGQDIVHVGSALEYGKDSSDLSESIACVPTTLYGESKLLGTKRLAMSCEQYGLKGVTVRLFSVYGPGEHNSRLLPSLLNLAKNQSLPLTEGQQKRDFTYVEDVVEGLLRIGVINKSEAVNNDRVINLATGQLNSVRSFVEIAASILTIDFKNLKFGEIPVRKEEMQHLPVTNALLKQQTGWVPSLSIAEGIGRCVKFLN